jgi:hypothetical protein
VTQEAEHLPSKLKALIQIPELPKKGKKKFKPFLGGVESFWKGVNIVRLITFLYKEDILEKDRYIMILHKTKFEIILIHCQIPHFFGGGTIF